MTLTAVIVLFPVTWFLVFFIVLPLRLTTQGDAGTRVPGTPAGAPLHEIVGRKAWITTLWAAVVWALLVAFIASGAVTVRDLDVFGRMGPDPASEPVSP